MTTTPSPQPVALEQWLTVQQACSLIGVAPATLRRWSAAGDVPAFTTPGGHRRFARSTILGLLPTAGRARPNLEHLGETPQHMTRVYRRHLTQALHGATWLAGLGADQVQSLRDHGRAITASLLAVIDAPTPEQHQAALLEAVAAATECGRIAAQGSVTIGETVETFLRFRALFLSELVAMSRCRGLDTVAATDLLVSANQAIDQLQVAVVSGHQVEMAQHPPTAQHAPTAQDAPTRGST
jgi:excisionase family DNA binding protein